MYIVNTTMKNWKSLKEMFIEMNTDQEFRYIVLRNYEELLNEDFLNTHSDIDLLCDNSKKLVNCISGTYRSKKPDGIHYKVFVNGQIIPVDIRTVGDGYYDPHWAIDMLNTRRLYNDLCYIPDEENNFFSLLYHAVVQKDELSDEYRNKLSSYCNSLLLYNEEVYINVLDTFMKSHKYFYYYPKDYNVIFKKKFLCSKLIKQNYSRSFIRNYIHFKRFLSHCYRYFKSITKLNMNR